MYDENTFQEIVAATASETGTAFFDELAFSEASPYRPPVLLCRALLIFNQYYVVSALVAGLEFYAFPL